MIFLKNESEKIAMNIDTYSSLQINAILYIDKLDGNGVNNKINYIVYSKVASGNQVCVPSAIMQLSHI